MLNKLAVGATVVYVDSRGVPRDALVTAIWGPTDREDSPPCINVVIVSPDETMRDAYGRQIQRETSVVHRTRQPAHGYYYMMPGDVLNPVASLQA